jgi:hypothetical protein
MAKKKKKGKKKKNISMLKEIDSTLNGTYEELMQEIEMMQLKLNYADSKARKIAKKKGKKNPKYYNYEKLRKEAREEIVKEMEGNNFLDRALNILNDVAPIITIIARLIASVILAILSITSVKVNIKPDTLNKMDTVYKKAMAIQ